MYVYRQVEWGDREQMLRWRNDRVTRENALDTREITKEEHEKWLRRSLSMSTRKLWIIQRDQVDIGVLRLDQIDDDHIEVSIYLSPEARYHGHGQRILKDACQWARMWKPQSKRLVARIKKGNLPSIKSFTKAGFQQVKEEANNLWMCIELHFLLSYG